MQLALVNSERIEAFPGGRGTCPNCGTPVVAKCGPRVINHWAHHRLKDCDPWWENETEWHRSWKNLFPVECREVSHFALDGEVHRADVKTPTGIVIEFQHSSLSDVERLSRERFYKNLIWIVDGLGFQKNFDIYHPLPHPKSEPARDLVWSKAKRHMHGANDGLFFRLSEARQKWPGITKAEVREGLIHSIANIRDALETCYCGHHQFDWVRPREAWLEAGCPVFIDFGDDHLVKLETYDESDLKCIRFVQRSDFIEAVMSEQLASEVCEVGVQETRQLP